MTYPQFCKRVRVKKVSNLEIQGLSLTDRLWSSESDFCRRQILMTKVDPRFILPLALAPIIFQA